MGSPCFSFPHTFAESGAGGEVSVINVKVGCHNVRGFKINCEYCALLLKSLDILAISEHWLHNFDLTILQKAHLDFTVYTTFHKEEEGNLFCASRYIHGNEQVAILWRKTSQVYVHERMDISTDRVVGIKLLLHIAKSVLLLRNAWTILMQYLHVSIMLCCWETSMLTQEWMESHIL